MGAPKQKWTAEEEAALKAGIQKYGLGKWSTILKDPDFSTVLRSRSNVDLKDKWRNLNCMASGLGSRHRARVLIKKNQPIARQDEENTAGHISVENESESHDASSFAASGEISQESASKKQISRLDDLILKTIAKLNEPRGSSRQAIAQDIEECYSPPPDFERALMANLKTLTENGRLIKVRHQFRIAPRSMSAAGKRQTSLDANGDIKEHPETGRKDIALLSRAQIDAEIEKMKTMSAAEAAAAAAQAVAEAEVALAEAEAAAKEAEDAEAEAEAARCFADAAQKAFKRTMIRV